MIQNSFIEKLRLIVGLAIHVEATVWKASKQYVIYCFVSICLLAGMQVIVPSADGYFKKYFASVDPTIVTAAGAAIGFVCLMILRYLGGIQILRGGETLRGIFFSFKTATIFGVIIFIADFFIRYPEDTNVPVPTALMFYPTVGFVAEVVFHLLPLTVLFLLMSPLKKRLSPEKVLWIAALLVAITEPTFQITFGGKPFTPAAAFTWLHVFLFAYLQLSVFRRFDFVSMYVFRLFYYAYWHIIWGVIRLEVLF